jgi:hypothetical protein
VLLEQFTEMIDRIEMTDGMFSWLVRALRETFAEVRHDRDAAVARLQKERERLRERMKQTTSTIWTGGSRTRSLTRSPRNFASRSARSRVSWSSDSMPISAIWTRGSPHVDRQGCQATLPGSRLGGQKTPTFRGAFELLVS